MRQCPICASAIFGEADFCSQCQAKGWGETHAEISLDKLKDLNEKNTGDEDENKT